MSIGAGVVVAVTFQQVDNAPDTETGTERDNEGLKNGDCLFKKCHIGDSQMIELQDSIKKYGVLNPLIVRPKIEGYYEIISGHRRKYAAEKLGYKKIPVIICMLQDDEAVVIMVDFNLQREQITPSEKAYAYKMKYDAIKKKAGRKNCSQVDHNTGKRSIDVIGELCGDSAKQVHSSIKSKRWSWKDGIVREFRNRTGTGREKGSSDRCRSAGQSHN